MVNNNRLKEHRSLIEKLLSRQKKLESVIQRYSIIRISIFLTGIILSFIFFLTISNQAFVITLSLFTFAFVYVATIHAKFFSALKRTKRYISIKQRNVNALLLHFAKLPLPDALPEEEKSDIDDDLFISGKNSLMQILDTTISKEGFSLLYGWLTSTPKKKSEIEERQELIRELRNETRFRERLLLNTRESEQKFSGKSILAFLKSIPERESFGSFLIIYSVLTVINVVILILIGLQIFPYQWLASPLVYLVLYQFGLKRVKLVSSQAEFLSDLLSRLLSVFLHFERTEFAHSPLMRKLTESLRDNSRCPSTVLRKMESSFELLKISGNPLVWFIIIQVFPWDYYHTWRIHKNMSVIKTSMDRWLSIVYKVDGLSALATFACLHPAYTFPEIVPEDTIENPLTFEKMGHPLIPCEQLVTNNFFIHKQNQITLITGSNMSGKSTFLRTVGINIALAYSGSVVAADSFTLPVIRLFTCISISDSIANGISYFYAEVKRLKSLFLELENGDDRKVLYLIDEIFRGTNNRERFIGSKAVIESLAKKTCYGFISTHDLELVNLENEIDTLVNYHFRESIQDGKMHFDYKIHEGPCPTTNALTIIDMELGSWLDIKDATR